MAEHTSKQFDAELESVRSRVLHMGGLVEQQITRAMEALISGDMDLMERVIADDHRVNALEVDLDESCSHIIARRQPAAGDLRLLITVIKTITDLERIGDQAEKVGRIALRLAGTREGGSQYVDLVHLGNHVRQLLHDTLDAFARMDPEAAVMVAREDINVDKEYEALMRQLITYMMEDPRTITRVLDVIWAARALERIGDHARNICEYVIYLVKGKDVRHVSLDEMEQEVRGRH